MARLEITSPSGKVRETALPPGAALTVGRHAASDIRVNAEGVEQIHLRLMPDGKGEAATYTVTAGTLAGVRVNGAAVAEATLADGDVMQVGPAKFVFHSDAPAPPAADIGERSIELAAISEENLPAWADPDRAKAAAKRDATKRDAAKSPRKAAKREDDEPADSVAVSALSDPAAAGDGEGEEDDGLGALAALAEQETGKSADELEKEAAGGAGDAAPAAADGGEQPVLLGPPGGGRFAPLTKLAGPPKRPGEQSILKSRLVVGLASTAAVLTIAAFAIALLTSREEAARLYAAADDARQGGRYTEAVQLFDRFVEEHPADALVPVVRTDRGLTKIEREVAGSGGDWAEGVEEIDRFVRENRDLETFKETAPALSSLARRAALGAAAEATGGGPRELLETVKSAAAVHRRYGDAEAAAFLDEARQIESALKTATAAVVKRETFGGAREAVAAALEAGDFAAAHRARENLVTRYRDLRDDRDVRQLLEETLTAEREAVAEIPAADAPPPPPPARPAALVPAFVARASGGEASDGRSVLTRAGPDAYAVDAVTGEPLWRAPVGGGGAADPAVARPFVPADAAGSTVLLTDAVDPALLSVDRASGAVKWRLPLPAAAAGPPVARGGTALVGCADGSLLAVDPETGRVTGGLKFPRPVVSPPAVVGGVDGAGALLLAADSDVLYTLVGSPPRVAAVSYAGHAPGSVTVPPLALGALALLCENDRPDAARLRAFRLEGGDETDDPGRVRQVGAARVAGTVDVAPELRGDRLFVSGQPERMAAFAVSDESGRDVFSPLAAAQLPDPEPVPTFLAAGPDGLLWAAGSALRLLQLTGEGLQLGSKTLAEGRHVRPPAVSGERLYTTRLNPAGTATLFAAARAEAMTGSARTVLAPTLLAVAADPADPARAALLYAGGVTATAGDWPAAGETRFLGGRPLPGLADDEPAPVLARRNADGTVTAAVGGDDPRAWTLDAAGRAGRPADLPGPPELAPLPLGPGLLVALDGRLELADVRRSVAAFTAPVSEGDPPAFTALVRLSETRAAVADAGGTLRLIEYRETPTPSLTEVAAVRPGWFADVPPVGVFADGGEENGGAATALAAAGSDGALHLLSAATLGELAAAPLPGRAAFPPAFVPTNTGGRVLAAAGGAVASFAAADLGSPAAVTLPAAPVGPPHALGDAAAVALAGGRVLRFAPDGSAAGTLAETGEALAGGLLTLGGEPAAVTAGGVLVKLNFAAASADAAQTARVAETARVADAGETP